MADLIPSILAHAFGGVALAVLVWGLGLGAIALAQPGRADRRTGAHAYALGLAIATVAAGAYLFSPWLAIGAVPCSSCASQDSFGFERRCEPRYCGRLQPFRVRSASGPLSGFSCTHRRRG